jgi:putative sigma-54 modulation protein
MDIQIKGRHMVVAPDIQAYANDKIGKVARLVDGPTTMVQIELFSEKNPSIKNNQVAEVTVFSKGPVIRAREAASDMHAAIDMVADKLDRRITHLRGKIKDKHKSGPRGFKTEMPIGDEDDVVGPAIVKTKELSVKPMSTDEAILQMELLGHDFFVFMEPDSADINVLYRRRDGDYGIITPRNM